MPLIFINLSSAVVMFTLQSVNKNCSSGVLRACSGVYVLLCGWFRVQLVSGWLSLLSALTGEGQVEGEAPLFLWALAASSMAFHRW